MYVIGIAIMETTDRNTLFILHNAERTRRDPHTVTHTTHVVEQLPSSYPSGGLVPSSSPFLFKKKTLCLEPTFKKKTTNKNNNKNNVEKYYYHPFSHLLSSNSGRVLYTQLSTLSRFYGWASGGWGTKYIPRRPDEGANDGKTENLISVRPSVRLSVDDRKLLYKRP